MEKLEWFKNNNWSIREEVDPTTGVKTVFEINVSPQITKRTDTIGELTRIIEDDESSDQTEYKFIQRHGELYKLLSVVSNKRTKAIESFVIFLSYQSSCEASYAPNGLLVDFNIHPKKPSEDKKGDADKFNFFHYANHYLTRPLSENFEELGNLLRLRGVELLLSKSMVPGERLEERFQTWPPVAKELFSIVTEELLRKYVLSVLGDQCSEEEKIRITSLLTNQIISFMPVADFEVEDNSEVLTRKVESLREKIV